MNNHQQIISAISLKGLLPLYFHSSGEVSAGILKALYNAGIEAVEYTNRGEEALVNFTKLKTLAKSEMPGMHMGIGTIKDERAAKSFIDAGADFIISPGISEEVIEMAKAHGILWIPGCMTPTEIMRAEKLGASVVKLFPGNVLGPSYVAAIKDLFPMISFMPTGGVDTTQENLHEWFSSGVMAVGMGSKLLSKQIMKDKNYNDITSLTADTLKTIAAVRKQLHK
ncbi:MAG: bifunctional 4-hydroxy-2-oxoglutarate aldolase/2-dehydro-3-deoxy-phosphogluconate aldolase [Chitinophagaceae bacterium]|nr:bifunctional 4-hydroxy-2-oxoglutarate aldolase/2-dehydro-3-deoxy-phosphogluconate aldolase [Chitinophagaceae bacterium]